MKQGKHSGSTQNGTIFNTLLNFSGPGCPDLQEGTIISLLRCLRPRWDKIIHNAYSVVSIIFWHMVCTRNILTVSVLDQNKPWGRRQPTVRNTNVFSRHKLGHHRHQIENSKQKRKRHYFHYWHLLVGITCPDDPMLLVLTSAPVCHSQLQFPNAHAEPRWPHLYWSVSVTLVRVIIQSWRPRLYQWLEKWPLESFFPMCALIFLHGKRKYSEDAIGLCQWVF